MRCFAAFRPVQLLSYEGCSADAILGHVGREQRSVISGKANEGRGVNPQLSSMRFLGFA